MVGQLGTYTVDGSRARIELSPHAGMVGAPAEAAVRGKVEISCAGEETHRHPTTQWQACCLQGDDDRFVLLTTDYAPLARPAAPCTFQIWVEMAPTAVAGAVAAAGAGARSSRRFMRATSAVQVGAAKAAPAKVIETSAIVARRLRLLDIGNSLSFRPMNGRPGRGFHLSA